SDEVEKRTADELAVIGEGRRFQPLPFPGSVETSIDPRCKLFRTEQRFCTPTACRSGSLPVGDEVACQGTYANNEDSASGDRATEARGHEIPFHERSIINMMLSE